MGTLMHQSLGAEVGTLIGQAKGSCPSHKLMIVAREVKSYKQKSAPIRAAWLAKRGKWEESVVPPKKSKDHGDY